MISILRWLEDLGLGKYGPAFVEADIDLSVLPDLSDADFESLGVTLGHRKKLSRAIAILGSLDSEAFKNAAAPIDPERRLLTVMFCDLVGSTALSTKLDPEALRDITREYYQCCTEAITQAGGFVAKYMGDGVLAYFGYPQANEDDAVLAARAALQLIDTVGRIEDGSLRVRVGLATGLVVVGDLIGHGSAQERSVFGETPNLAARLQGLAAPGTVVVSAGTHRLLGRWFECRDLGAVTLKGFSDGVPAWQILAPSSIRSRFDARTEGGLKALVGREGSLNLLLDLWHRAEASEGQAVLVNGEPGIGKSRIVRAFQDRLAAGSQETLSFFCFAQHQGSALHPVIAQLEHSAGLISKGRPSPKLAKLKVMLARSQATQEELALIADLLSIPTGGRYRLRELSPQRRRERTFEALLAQVTRLAEQQPILLVYEDLHWIDPTSLELLGLALQRWRALPVLVLMTARPEFKPAWPGDVRVREITLSRLHQREATAMVARIASDKSLPQEILTQILDRTDGVPLFLEELTKFVLESGMLREEGDQFVMAGSLRSFAIPATLHESLLARLDRLGPAREVAQIGAALGRRFSYQLLRAIADAPNPSLNESLAQLVHSELMFADRAAPDVTFTFKHALIQDAAYQTMLKRRRVQLHTRIADVMRRQFPEIAEAQPETIAHHYTEATLAEPAIHYWRAAGQRALQRSAVREAINHINDGIALLDEVPDASTRAQFELDLQSAAGLAWTAVNGYSSAAAEAAYSRARELCSAIGDTPQVFPVLYGILLNVWSRGRNLEAKEVNLDLFRSAAGSADDELQLIARGTLGAILCHLGELAESEAELAAAQAGFDPERHLSITYKFGTDPGSFPWSYRSWNQALLGYPDTALALAHEAVLLSRRTGHQLSVTACLCFGACCAAILRNPDEVFRFAEEALTLSREHGFPFFEAQAAIYLGWSLGQRGKPAEGVVHMRDGIAAWRATGANIFLGWYYALLSETELAAGDIAIALTTVDKAAEWSETNTEHAWDCFIHCHRGDALLASGNGSEAQAEYRLGLAWARLRFAKWAELYAAQRLADCWRSTGNEKCAYQLMAPICDWFVEGSSSPLLNKARALLTELRPM